MRGLTFALAFVAQGAAADDLGGSVVAYALIARSLESISIDYVCASACTLFLSVPDVCVGPRARFIFHEASGADPALNEWATSFMFESYPPWVQNWITSRGGLGPDLIEIPAEIVRANLPTCGDTL